MGSLGWDAIAAAQALNFPLLLADLLGGSVFIATVVGVPAAYPTWSTAYHPRLPLRLPAVRPLLTC